MSTARPSVPGLLRLALDDDVLIATRDLVAGPVACSDGGVVDVVEAIELGHKVAARDLVDGDPVVRYGMPIGVATRPIARGQWVHTHNLASRYIVTFAHRGGVS